MGSLGHDQRERAESHLSFILLSLPHPHLHETGLYRTGTTTTYSSHSSIDHRTSAPIFQDLHTASFLPPSPSPPPSPSNPHSSSTMLSQPEVVTMLSKNPPQHEAYQILSAYIYNKCSHGGLPSETLAKVLSIHRKISLRSGPISPSSPLGRAFEAARLQLTAANRKWVTMGPQAFGTLGQIGSASSTDAIAAWTKATDGRVKVFDDGSRGGVAIDAGRVTTAGGPSAPPPYQPEMVPENETTGEEGPKTQQQLDVEAGRAHLANLRAQMVLREEERENYTPGASPMVVPTSHAVV